MRRHIKKYKWHVKELISNIGLPEKRDVLPIFLLILTIITLLGGYVNQNYQNLANEWTNKGMVNRLQASLFDINAYHVDQQKNELLLLHDIKQDLYRLYEVRLLARIIILNQKAILYDLCNQGNMNSCVALDGLKDVDLDSDTFNFEQLSENYITHIQAQAQSLVKNLEYTNTTFNAALQDMEVLDKRISEKIPSDIIYKFLIGFSYVSVLLFYFCYKKKDFIDKIFILCTYILLFFSVVALFLLLIIPDVIFSTYYKTTSSIITVFQMMCIAPYLFDIIGYIPRYQYRKKILREIKKIEFSKINYNKEDKKFFDFIEGKIPILISAPHGTKHFRSRTGEWREEDEYTSAIAIKLGQLTGAHVIYTKNKTKEDPNDDEVSEYRDEIKKIIKKYNIKFVADIHGAGMDYDFSVCVGTMDDSKNKSSCPIFKDVIINTLKDFQGVKYNLKNFEAKKRTLTRFIWKKCGVEAAQFEIRADYRIVERKPDSSEAQKGEKSEFEAKRKNVLNLLYHLSEVILKINEEIKKEVKP